MTRVPRLINTSQELHRWLPALAADGGPVAADTERACGFRYFQRAYLIQLKTASTGTCLIDPVSLSAEVLNELAAALADKEWIIHSVHNDLPCLRELGLVPSRLFDTEVAARMLRRERVGLGPLLEDVLGIHLAKEHSNSDWSQRPLPLAWLSYAADDVEYLIELAAALHQELAQAGKLEWAEQEFAYLLARPDPEPKPDPWRSTTNIHLVRTRRGLAIIERVWTLREQIARDLDLSPHLIVTDRTIAAMAAHSTHDDVSESLAALSGGDWTRKVDPEHLAVFRDAVIAAGQLGEDDLPPYKVRRGLPATGRWARSNPEAAKRWELVRPAVNDLAEQHQLPPEHLIAPKALRALLWEPTGLTASAIDRQLADEEVRDWQRALLVPLIADLLGSSAEGSHHLGQDLVGCEA